MTQREYEGWREFHRLFPIDDHHRLYRPAALIARSMAGGDIGPKLEWLSPDPSMAHLNESDARTLAAFGLKPPTRH